MHDRLYNNEGPTLFDLVPKKGVDHWIPAGNQKKALQRKRKRPILEIANLNAPRV